MTIDSTLLRGDERATFQLRALYQKYGYTRFKMSKFEEYDFYMRNKDFLVSDGLITFTEPSGRLMALKPDVTLSIIKNFQSEGRCVRKVYYDENVYRIAHGTHAFREIMQTGLEILGDIGTYDLYEAVMLAAESLRCISDSYILDLSHMGILCALIDSLALPEAYSERLMPLIGTKNLHEIEAVCLSAGASQEATNELLSVLRLYGSIGTVLPALKETLRNPNALNALSQLDKVCALLEKGSYFDCLRIDFSIVSDLNYYNGIVFRGFVEGLPGGILSGGQYDALMARMGKDAGAVGFAVYLDQLERLMPSQSPYDADTLLLYDDACDPRVLAEGVRILTSNGQSVMAQKQRPEKLRFRQCFRLTEGGLNILEQDD